MSDIHRIYCFHLGGSYVVNDYVIIFRYTCVTFTFGTDKLATHGVSIEKTNVVYFLNLTGSYLLYGRED